MDSCDSWTCKGLSPETLAPLDLILPAMDEGFTPGFCAEVDGDGFSSCLSDETFSHIESSSSVSPGISAQVVASPPNSNSYPSVDSPKPVQEETFLLPISHENGDCCTVIDCAKRAKVNGHGAELKAQSSQSQVPKLGEKITALQQLVCPFGKTDTASVLLEAIGYIKFLQDQVDVLSSPYMKANLSNNKGSFAAMDLRSRGLCLVPISCTANVASSNGADYWISGISGCSR